MRYIAWYGLPCSMSNRQDDSRCHKACHLALFQGFPKLLDESSCCFSLHQACLKHFRLVSVFFDGQQSCSTRTVQAIAASRASSSSTREELLSLNAPSFCHTAYDFFLPLRRLIYAKPYEPQTARPHTAGDAGDVGVADSELRFFLGNLRVCSSRAGRELSNEPPAGEIVRLDCEKVLWTSLVTFSADPSHLGQGLSPLPDDHMKLYMMNASLIL